MKRFREGVVFETHRLLYHSTLSLRVMKRERERERERLKVEVDGIYLLARLRLPKPPPPSVRVLSHRMYPLNGFKLSISP